MNREEFDQLFDQAFDEAAHSSQLVPDPGPSWARIQKKLARRAAIKRRLKLVPYIAASFLLGAYLFGTPAVTTAFKPVIEAVATIKDGVLEMTIGQPKASGTLPKTAPPPGIAEDGGSNKTDGQDLSYRSTTPIRHDTLKAAAKHLNFALPSIGHVPESFTLTEIISYRHQDSNKGDQLSLLYERESGESGLYRISIRKLEKDQRMKLSSDDPDIESEMTTINGYEAFLQITNEGYASLQYFANDLLVNIFGILDQEVIMEIGSNIQWR
ncbi:hypothetical protein B1748_33075 [Paenibacillus sp. MY03]|jgi:hypothetical protein|uniref:DUF4367 domain-containing protein n=1 Tax=Paenibacillus sp. MY03 TaxID=302980 RepID=UPI000B3C1B41|nr:DUF4367 domain-containing protein [Paenibacillus sp. MY03]OUS68802.1 hypothetical protein B1748_33075 [Paenibacillus sp. MY03]